MTPKRRLLTLIFACLYFKKSLLIKKLISKYKCPYAPGPRSHEIYYGFSSLFWPSTCSDLLNMYVCDIGERRNPFHQQGISKTNCSELEQNNTTACSRRKGFRTSTTLKVFTRMFKVHLTPKFFFR